MSERLGWRRRLLFTVTLAGVAVLSSEIPLQLYYRLSVGDWLFRRTLPPIYEADPVRCYRVKANLDYVHHTNEFAIHLYTNAQSFRTDARRAPVAYAKPADVYRVLFLGPSFTFGWGSDFEETYAARIARGLRVPGKRVELLNAGTPSQPVEPQLCWLEREGYRYQPDLVVQTSYGEGVVRMPEGCPESLACPLVEDSLLYSEAPSWRQRAIAAVKSTGIGFYGYYLYHAVTEGARNPGVGTGKELYPDAGKDGDLPALVQSYQGFVDFVHSRVGEDTQVAFLHIPFSFMVHEGDRSRWKHILDIDPVRARAITRAGIAALQKRGITIVDTLDRLIERAERERQFFWLDIHLTPAGNLTVTDEVLPVLQDRVLGKRSAQRAAGVRSSLGQAERAASRRRAKLTRAGRPLRGVASGGGRRPLKAQPASSRWKPG